MGVDQRRFHIVVFQLYDCTMDLNLISGDGNQTDEMIGCCCCCFCCRFPVLPAPLRVFWQWCTPGKSDNRRCRCRRRPALCPRCLRQNIQRNVNGRTKTELEMHSTETQQALSLIIKSLHVEIDFEIMTLCDCDLDRWPSGLKYSDVW